MEEFNDISNYLLRMGYTRQTVKSYMYSIGHYLTVHPDANCYKYKDVLNFMTEISQNNKNPDRINAVLAAIKKYYDYLIDVGIRNEHPCRNLTIKQKRNRDIIHQDLFTSAELELLMEREERYQELKVKNQTLISLLIYQGLTAGEVSGLKTSHIDLDNGTIYIRESKKQTRRHMEIQPRQYRLIDKYSSTVRATLLNVETDIFLVGKLGTPITVDDINYMVSTFKPLFPDRNLNPRTIRQSVISNWLNEKRLPLEQVQLLAGHRWISATAKYRYSPIAEQRDLINRFHPLK